MFAQMDGCSCHLQIMIKNMVTTLEWWQAFTVKNEGMHLKLNALVIRVIFQNALIASLILLVSVAVMLLIATFLSSQSGFYFLLILYYFGDATYPVDVLVLCVTEFLPKSTGTDQTKAGFSLTRLRFRFVGFGLKYIL